MSNLINFDAKELIQSQSPNAPFIAIFESESDLSVFYAVLSSVSDPKIVDQVVIELPENHADTIRWNQSGERAALLIHERIICVFDFKDKLHLLRNLLPRLKRIGCGNHYHFQRSWPLSLGLISFLNNQLDSAIETLKNEESQTNRLLFYKTLLRVKIICSDYYEFT